MGAICSLARVRVRCDNPFCVNTFFADRLLHKNPYIFCRECKEAYPYHSLVLQTKRRAHIRDLLIEASSIFPNAKGMSDYLEVSPPTLYSWLRRFFGMGFQQFKRHYICKAQRCMVLDTSTMPITWKYHISETVKNNRSCACFVSIGGQSLMITTAKPDKLRHIFKNAPEAVDDGTGIHKVRYPVFFCNLRLDEYSNKDDRA